MMANDAWEAVEGAIGELMDAGSDAITVSVLTTRGVLTITAAGTGGDGYHIYGGMMEMFAEGMRLDHQTFLSVGFEMYIIHLYLDGERVGKVVWERGTMLAVDVLRRGEDECDRVWAKKGWEKENR